MEKKNQAYRGGLLGFAVGDALGCAVHDKSWETIMDDYGPDGLLGYDLCAGEAGVTSYTQVLAYIANAFLVTVSRGSRGDYLKAHTAALRQWAKRQHFPRDPEPAPLWVARMPQLRKRSCKDARMLEALRFPQLGTFEKPISRASSCGVLSYAAALALFFDPKRIPPERLGQMAADMAAVTHGSAEAVFSAVVLAYGLAGVLHAPEVPLKEQFVRAVYVMQEQFGGRHPVRLAAEPILEAIRLSEDPDQDPREVMEKLSCNDAPSALAGGIYAALCFSDDFDAAVVCAVNHSGASCAVAAVTGAILGAKMGENAIPGFYLESLECKEILEELADDLIRGSVVAGLFDTDWDQKYIHGIPLLPTEE